ncbi:ubiquinol oxidase subunit II [Salinisphaera sp. Q1T1-3]|uniref:ubiquinol oxidase subunit II n=1 Tax=Salinisphaera sp. Q1T1-3 TaxID=2321229 RepID=UPI000E7702DB|nr:ubiquinol oxidase subunit II [Salinisphaera sp. Q1T1-3]RJS91671.1 ubiquinol oxidase subunit II [Salinisphaera sp. Q1T1-3]
MLRNSLRLSAGVATIALLLLVSGCSLSSLSTMNPVGPIGETERDVTIYTILLLLFVLIPIVAGTVFIAWHYRSTSSNSAYTPDWDHSWLVEVFCWGGPIVILIILAVITWISTHDLDPYKAIESDKPPLEIEAVATDWKWLFIYPDEHVASVNEFAFPVDTPLEIHLTSNSVMNAFMVQRMGTQIFAMSGMQTKLHLMSHEKGDFDGGNYQYNGEGFAKMRFVAKAMSESDYQQWIAKVRQQGSSLDLATFQKFAEPSVVENAVYFAPVSEGLFGDIIGQFHAPKGSAMHAELDKSAAH